MADHRRVVPRCPCECTTVTKLLLDVAHDGSFRTLAYGKDVPNSEGCFFAAVDEGTSVHTLSGDESLFAQLVAVWIPENDLGEGSTSERNLRIEGRDY